MPRSTTGTSIPRVDDDLCQICSRCPPISACRGRAILRFDRDEPPYIDAASCDGCYVCIPACPHEAIVLDGSMELDEELDEQWRNSTSYRSPQCLQEDEKR